ncbi:MAG: PorV/PorQ family protein [Candidatus Marinimicrobia bacterium]|nr:PorV/PorQ family protein [Candidatus Neomarinimicrobiota bacterium]
MYKKMIMLLVIAVSMSFGQYKGGTTAAQFLKIGIGSRATGMGEAYVAMSQDASGLYWNPAGIAQAGGGEILFQRNNWIADVAINYMGVIFPLYGVGTVGISITSLTMDDMPVTTELEPNGTGEEFTASDLALQVTLARSLTDRFSIGFNGKYIQQTIWHSRASAMAVDVGTLFRTQFNDMRLGMSISNYGSGMRMSGRDILVRYDPAPGFEGNNDAIPADYALDDWDLPLIFRVGVAMDVIEVGVTKVTVAVDAIHPNDNYESINIGTELSILDKYFLRGGWKSPFVETNTSLAASELEAREEGFTFGAGFDLPIFGSASGLRFDYAYADFGRLKDVQRFNFSLYF